MKRTACDFHQLLWYVICFRNLQGIARSLNADESAMDALLDPTVIVNLVNGITL